MTATIQCYKLSMHGHNSNRNKKARQYSKNSKFSSFLEYFWVLWWSSTQKYINMSIKAPKSSKIMYILIKTQNNHVYSQFFSSFNLYNWLLSINSDSSSNSFFDFEFGLETRTRLESNVWVENRNYLKLSTEISFRCNRESRRNKK